MTTSKKVAALVLAIFLCIALAACGNVTPSGRLEMDSTTGAGTATFTMVVPKNGAPNVGNNFVEPNGDDEPNDTAYITSPDALLRLVQENVPEGFTVTVEEQIKMVEHEDEFGDIDTVDEGSFDYTITFSFIGIEDYNGKINQWLPKKCWDAAEEVLGTEISPAILNDEGTALTVDTRILNVICQWGFDLISTDTTGAVVDGGSGFDYQYCYNMDKATFSVALDGKEAGARYGGTDSLLTAGSGAAEATAPPVTDPPATESAESFEPSEPVSTAPEPVEGKHSEGLTGGGVVIIVAAVFVIGVICVVLILRKHKKKQ